MSHPKGAREDCVDATLRTCIVSSPCATRTIKELRSHDEGMAPTKLCMNHKATLLTRPMASTNVRDKADRHTSDREKMWWL